MGSLDLGDKVESLLAPGRVGVIEERFGQGWYIIRWADGAAGATGDKGQGEFYRRITDEEYVALVLGNGHGRKLG